MHKIRSLDIRVKIGFFLTLLLVLPPTSLAFAWKEPLRVVLDWDYPPFTYIDEKGNFVGICVDFWKQFTEKTGIQVALVPMEWHMAHQVMLQKQAEVIDTIFYTSERDAYLDYTKPLFPITSSVYYRKNLPISSLQDIHPYLVGAKEKDALIDIARGKNPSIHFQLYGNYSDIVKAAKRGKIQVFLMDDPPANYYLAKEELLYEFYRIPFPTLNHLYLATWEGNREILNLLQEGIDKFTPQELQALYQRYLPQTERYPSWLWKAIFVVVISFTLFFVTLSLFNRLLREKVNLATRELIHKNQILLETEEKLYRAIELTSVLPFFTLEEKEFFSKVLDLALEIITKAQYGAVILINEQDKPEIRVVRGHDQRLVGFTFQKEDLLVIEKIQVRKDVLDPHRKFSSPEDYKKLLVLSRPVAETLIAPLRWRDKFFGHL
ncbi:MAG: transporter substrate-binding domain-containing protein, partial [Candidatus Caldatribacteriaceae bacterium]